MKEAKEIRAKINELQKSLEQETHKTLESKAVLALLSDLAEVVERHDNRLMGKDQSRELE